MAGVAEGVFYLILIMVAMVAGVWVLAHATGVVVSHPRHPRPPAPDAALPPGMPIERIAADLRRIRPQAIRSEPGTPMARRVAIVAAYDDVLLDACRALDVATELSRLTDPLERESERLRTEAELARAGVDLS
jgi:hypothetical protein